MTIFAYCYRSGEIGLTTDSSAIPHQVIVFAVGDGAEIQKIVSARSRHAKDSDVLLVPGVPEASEGDELEAFEKWHAWAFPEQIWYVHLHQEQV